MVIARKSLLNKLLTRKVGRLEYAGWLILVPVFSVFGFLAVAGLYALFGIEQTGMAFGCGLVLGIFISWPLVALPGHWRLGDLGADYMLKTLYWLASASWLLYPAIFLYGYILHQPYPLPNPMQLFKYFLEMFRDVMILFPSIMILGFGVLVLWYVMVVPCLCFQLLFLVVKKLPQFLTRKISESNQMPPVSGSIKTFLNSLLTRKIGRLAYAIFTGITIFIFIFVLMFILNVPLENISSPFESISSESLFFFFLNGNLIPRVLCNIVFSLLLVFFTQWRFNDIDTSRLDKWICNSATFIAAYCLPVFSFAALIAILNIKEPPLIPLLTWLPLYILCVALVIWTVSQFYLIGRRGVWQK